MGANTLTGLIPTMYQALDVVGREMVGMIPAVSLNASAEQAALNDPIKVPITSANALIDNTPAVTSPDAGDHTFSNVTIAITQSKSYPIRWNGEQQKSIKNTGTYDQVLVQQFAQAFRTLTNQVETDLVTATYQAASRAYGTAGTAPFGGSDLYDAAFVRKILDDNGVPQTDLHLVLGSAAVANLRGKQTILLKANEKGNSVFRETGRISDIQLDGFDLHNSNAVRQITKGTGANYVTSGASAVGVTSIVLATGTGTVNAGDVVTFVADSNNKYVVNTGVSAPGTIVIGAPGVRDASIPTGNAMTVGNSYTPNLAFHRSAVQLVTRAPARPTGPDGSPMDSADDGMILTDPLSGISFEVTVYRQFKQLVYFVGLAWGVAAIKPNHIATLIG